MRDQIFKNGEFFADVTDLEFLKNAGKGEFLGMPKFRCEKPVVKGDKFILHTLGMEIEVTVCRSDSGGWVQCLDVRL